MRTLVVIMGGIIINVIIGIMWYLIDRYRFRSRKLNFWFYLTIKGGRFRIALSLLIFAIIINIIGWHNTPW